MRTPYSLSAPRRGTTLVELLMFLAFFALSSSVLLAFFFMTTEQRIRQHTITTVELSGVQLMQTLGNRVRSAERVLAPAIGASGTILVLQLSDSALHPTILALSGTALYVAEGNTIKRLSAADVEISGLAIYNTSVTDDRMSVLLRFSVARYVPLTTPINYIRPFEALIPLFPDNQENVPCTCAVPSCVDGSYRWQYCIDAVCTDATVGLPCT